MKHYSIEYKTDGEFSKTETECVLASSKADAYKRFMDNHNWSVYSAWVSTVTYQNGNIKRFNTFSGNPY